MKKLLSIALLTSLTVLGACSQESTTAENETSAAELEQVLVAEAFHTLLYLPLYVADHEGIFEENGIELTGIRAAGTGPTALSSVLAGEAQFSIHGPEHVGFAKENGGNAKAVSAVANSAPVWILANEDVEFSNPEDLAGKKIIVGLAPGTSNTLLKYLLENAGLDESDVEITEVQNGSELGPVIAGQADLAVAYQPQVEQGISQGLKIVHEFPNDFPEFAFSTANTSQQLIEENPELVENFVKSLSDSLEVIHSNPDIAKEVAIEEFPELEADVVEAAVQRMIDNNVYPQSSTVTEAAFEAAIEMQKFVGNITTDMPYEDVVDPSFAAE